MSDSNGIWLPKDPPDGYGLAAQIAELSREMTVRRSVYPRWVKEGKLPPEIASARLGALSAALESLQALLTPKLPL
jgi:hypothetical protein